MISPSLHPDDPGSFDPFAATYQEIINDSVRASGEDFEYFVNLRVAMMKARLDRKVPGYRVSTLLDFGCGTGATERFLEEAFTTSRIVGVDPSVECLRLARLTSTKTRYIELIGTSLPLESGSIDLIYCNGTFHHIAPSQRNQVLNELCRVLPAGGFAFIYENNPCNPLTIRAMRVNPFDKDAHPIRLTELRKLCLHAGFEVVESWYYFFFPRFLRHLRRIDPLLGWVPLGGQYGVWLKKIN